LREAWLARETALEFQYKRPGVNNVIKRFLGGFFRRIVSRNANDQGRFVVIKTRLTTKRKGECKRRGDYIYVAKG
jgi:hypothetical protein